MKPAQKFLATFALGLLLLAGSANAEESGGSVLTNMDSTRLSGYVSSSANWQSHSPGVHPVRRWFEATFHRLRLFLWQ
jgi:hypothetical protein